MNKIIRNEKGETLPGLLVSSMIGAFLLIAVGLFVYTAFSTNTGAARRALVVSQANNLETTLRGDVQNALSIIPSSSGKTVTITIAGGTANSCLSTVWEITAVAGAATPYSTITRTTSNVGTQTVTAANSVKGIVTCNVTTATTGAKVTVASQVPSASVFAFTNYANRPVTVVDSTVTLAGSDTPANDFNVDDWKSTTLTKVKLVTLVNSTSASVTCESNTAAYICLNFSQTATLIRKS